MAKASKNQEAPKLRYFRLGKGANSFHDQKAGLSLAGDEVKAVPAIDAHTSKTLNIAKTNGHIVELTEAEGEAAMKESEAKAAAIKKASKKKTPIPPVVDNDEEDEEDEEDEDLEDEDEEDEEDEEEEKSKADAAKAKADAAAKGKK